MRNPKNVSWARMVLAFAAVLVVAGSGLALAAGPNPTYFPQSSVLIGPGTVAKTTSASYILRVTFVNGATADFPPTMGATFTAALGTIDASGNYTATGGFSKDRITGTFTQNGGTVTSSFIVNTP